MKYPSASAIVTARWKCPANVLLGVSAEDQRRANKCIPDLLATPAAVRFVSMEPLLGEITARWAKWVDINATLDARGECDHLEGLRRLDWVIVSSLAQMRGRCTRTGRGRSAINVPKPPYRSFSNNGVNGKRSQPIRSPKAPATESPGQ